MDVKLGRVAHSEWFDRLMRYRIDDSLDDLGDGMAEFLNWAEGYKGYNAQAGLWFQPPLYVEHTARGSVINHVNERVVEVPFALTHVASLSPGARVIDVGAAESTLSLSLASLGFRVTAIDPRGYPVAHPGIEVVSASVLDWPGPSSPQDAVFCISTLEHIGLASYMQPQLGEASADRRVVDRFHEWLKPDGHLILTVPWGAAGEDEFQRTYDDGMLDDLLVEWDIALRVIVVRKDATTWLTGAVLTETEGPAVAMIDAVRTG